MGRPILLMRRALRGAPPEVERELEAEGWMVQPTGGGHFRWRHPGGAIVFQSSSPSDWRSWKNHLARLRAAARKLREG